MLLAAVLGAGGPLAASAQEGEAPPAEEGSVSVSPVDGEGAGEAEASSEAPPAESEAAAVPAQPPAGVVKSAAAPKGKSRRGKRRRVVRSKVKPRKAPAAGEALTPAEAAAESPVEAVPAPLTQEERTAAEKLPIPLIPLTPISPLYP